MPVTKTYLDNNGNPLPASNPKVYLDESGNPALVAAQKQTGFDTNAARKAGYSDDEILQHLAQSRRFDVAGAQKAGYSKQEIISHLSQAPAATSSQQLPNVEEGSGADEAVKSGRLKANLVPSAHPHKPVGITDIGLSALMAGALDPQEVSDAQIPSAVGEGLVNLGKGAAILATAPVSMPIMGTKRALADLKSYRATGKTLDQLHNEQQKAQGYGPFYRYGLSPVNEALGVDVQGMEQSARQGDPGGVLHRQIAATTPVVASLGIEPAIRGAAGAKLPLAREESIYRLTQATNPDKLDVGHINAQGGGEGFEGNLNAVHDILTDHAGKTGILNKIDKARSPGYQMEAAAQTGRDAAATRPYFSRYLNPSEPDTASTVNVKSYGGDMNGPNSATIGQMSKRLTNINAELYPKFQKGGAGSQAAQAAVNADRAQVLQTEAAGIRGTINNYLGKKYNIPVKDLENLRGEYGKLMDVADTMQFRANAMKQAENTKAMTPYSERAPESLTELGGRIVGGAIDKIAGNPTTNALKKAFSYQGKPAPLPEPSPLPPQVPRRPPAWKTGPSGGTPPVPGPSSGLPPQVPSGANAAVDAIRKAGTGPEAEVSVVSPSGQTGTVPMSDLTEALNTGFKLQNPLVKPSTQSPAIPSK